MASNYEGYAWSEMEEDEIQIRSKMGNLTITDPCYGTIVDLFEKPHRLIYTDGEGHLQLDGPVLSALSHINKKISVVGVCGIYRSGKSYLMNWIAGEKSGFNLGDTIQSETKGIWIWCKKHPIKSDQVLVLLDTEGLGDPEKGDPDHDNKLFCLTLLMSSTLILNVKNVFDFDTLDKLAYPFITFHNVN
ncbi:guanylate-binding protein 5-like [Ruditapes philippinarum]|uniref:guanylate-binding protein 5-like n=1 Tax=Ruditapes philippinarum TaxID=129788 RepID=UPI00295B05D5|nr:guanylate-binding protein 5-like [Ruditapes philippinarum]